MNFPARLKALIDRRGAAQIRPLRLNNINIGLCPLLMAIFSLNFKGEKLPNELTPKSWTV
jgi:hypothetical protein